MSDRERVRREIEAVTAGLARELQRDLGLGPEVRVEYAGLSGDVFRPEVDASCSCGFVPDPCDRHQSLSEVERAAAQALYDDDEIEVGYEGIGGFMAGQAEETIAVLRRAGFRVVREVVTR